jgi:hypothetical protein
MKTSVSQMLPTTEREKQLMEFWYHKGYAEATLWFECLKNKRKVEVVITGKKPVRRPRGAKN